MVYMGRTFAACVSVDRMRQYIYARSWTPGEPQASVAVFRTCWTRWNDDYSKQDTTLLRLTDSDRLKSLSATLTRVAVSL